MALIAELNRVPVPQLLPEFIKLEVAGVLRRVAHLLGACTAAQLADVDFRLPDTALVREALVYTTEVSPGFLLNHCLRAYLFGKALALRDQVALDWELFALSCVLHDLGLTKHHDGPRSFEVEGADAAYGLLMHHGCTAERAAHVHEAIALHAAVGRALKGAPELAFLHLGAGMDVIGVRAEDFEPTTVAQILATHPRLDFKRCFVALIVDQAKRKPMCHIAGHVGLGFDKKIAAAPFSE
jgi:cyanamide hydratase family protein with HD domain